MSAPNDPPINPSNGTNAFDGFFTTDAVFLVTVEQIWLQVTVWTMVGCAFVFLLAGLRAARVNIDPKGKYAPLKALAVPIGAAIFGGFIGFTQGAITAALIGAVARSINSTVCIDIAAGLGLGQAICITYFHLGRADFIHR